MEGRREEAQGREGEDKGQTEGMSLGAKDASIHWKAGELKAGELRGTSSPQGLQKDPTLLIP